MEHKNFSEQEISKLNFSESIVINRVMVTRAVVRGETWYFIWDGLNLKEGESLTPKGAAEIANRYLSWLPKHGWAKNC